MTDQEQGLKRELTASQMAMVAVGGSIGTGLLLRSGGAIQVGGPAVVLTFDLNGLISWTVAMALGEMSAVHPAAGSFGVYADLYLNRWAGFIARYGYWFSVVIAIGSELVAAATYMQHWFPKVAPVVWMMVFGLFLLVINLFSVGHYGTFEYWFALIKVVTIFVFIVAGVRAAGSIMNFVVLTAALSGANATLYVTSRMLFSLARSGYAPRGLGRLNEQGVPRAALLVSMAGIVVAIVVQILAPEHA